MIFDDTKIKSTQADSLANFAMKKDDLQKLQLERL
jgi:hypothetical protein